MSPLMKSIHLLHIEDEPGAQELVQDIVRTSLSDVIYECLDVPIDQAFDAVRLTTYPVIIVLDLRLSQPRSEYETVIKVLSNLRNLQHRNAEVLILTGYLSDDFLRVLGEAGVPAERIYRKGQQFDRQKFVDTLVRIKEQMQSDRGSSSFRLVHLSDIHVGQDPASSFFHQDIRDELLNDLRNLRRECNNADAVLITGDTAFSGKKNEYAEAKKWIAATLEASGCFSGRVFVIPGNHDIDRGRISRTVDLYHKTIRACHPE